MTIGDYWGIQKIFEKKVELDFEQSWSCMIINNQKGKILLEETKNLFNLVQTKLNDIKQGNGRLYPEEYLE